MLRVKVKELIAGFVDNYKHTAVFNDQDELADSILSCIVEALPVVEIDHSRQVTICDCDCYQAGKQAILAEIREILTKGGKG